MPDDSLLYMDVRQAPMAGMQISPDRAALATKFSVLRDGL
jgi:hypothetical protein